MGNVRYLGRGGGGDGPEEPGPLGARGKPKLDPAGRLLDAPAKARREGPREARKTVVELPPLPEKIYFRIGEVAHLVGVEPYVLRYWENEFRSIRPTKSQRGQRVYSRRDVEQLRRIRGLLYEEGFTIAGAKKALRQKGLEPRAENDPVTLASHRAREALVEIRHDVEAFLRELGG